MSKLESGPPSSRPLPFQGKTAVIIEDQRLVAELLAYHCKTIGIGVVATVAEIAAGLVAVRTHRPHLVLLDFSLPDGNGLDAARTLMDEFPELRIVGISSHRDPWTMLQVQRVGLHGFVDKHEQDPQVLTEAISSVMLGHVFYTQVVTTATAALRRDPNAFHRVLSDYEMRVLSLIGESKSDEEIGALLDISPSTVQSRRRDIMRKLDVHSTPKLIHYALTHGITRVDQIRPPS